MTNRAFAVLSLCILAVGPTLLGQTPQPAETEGELGARQAYWRDRRGAFTPEERARALVAARQLEQAASLPEPAGASWVSRRSQPGGTAIRLPPNGTWSFLGPSPISTSSGNYAGRVPALAIDPTTAGASTVIYAAGANGGVWKSTNNGAVWVPLTDGQPTLAIGALAIDPNDHLVVYAGTGEPNQSADSYYGSGVLKSADGGATWALYGTPFFGTRASSISRIVVNPRDSANVFAASSLGLTRSTDGGVTWARVTGTGLPNGGSFVCDDVVVDGSTAPVNLYVVGRSGFGGTGYGVLRSTDGGGSWTALTSGLPAASSSFNYRSRMVMAPSNHNVLYLITVNSLYKAYSSTYNGGYYTTDGGTTWNQLLAMNADPADGGAGGQGWYDLQLAVDPLNDAVLYAAGVNVHAATNARGTSATGGWHNITNVYTSPNSGIHPDQHALAFGACSASPCRLYVGNDGGIYYSDNPTAASASVTFTNINTPGLGIAEFVGGDLGPDFAATKLALGGTQDNGTMRYSGASLWPMVLGGDGGFTAINRSNTNIMYTENYSTSVRRSTDGGNAWASMTAGLAGSPLFYAPFTIERTDPNHLAWGSTYVFETTNGAAPWYQGSAQLESSVQISTLAIAPSNGAVIYAGLTNGHIWRTAGAKSGAAAAYTQVSTGLSGQWVTQIWIDPADPNTAYATMGRFYRASSGYVFKTTNGGAAWTNISGNLPVAPVNSIVAYQANTGRVLVVGTDIGVFFSTNEGTSWSAMNTGLPTTAVNQLAIDSVPSAIVAFTHGRSVWSLGLVATSAIRYYTLSPCRVLDTRNATGSLGGPALSGGLSRTFPLAGACGIPASAVAVSGNVSVVPSTTPGELRLYAADQPLPVATAISFPAGRNRANNGFFSLSLDAQQRLTVLNDATSTVDVLLDVNGYFQ